MQQMQLFARNDLVPSWFANSLGKALSVLSAQLQVVKLDNTHVQISAAANAGAAVASIAGLWRWIEASLSTAMPGGAAGQYPIFLTAANNNIANVPVALTDNTNYAFGLQVLAPGATPTIVAGTVDVYRQIGVVEWDGTKITRVDQTVPAAPTHAYRHASGGADPIAPSDIGAVAVADNSAAQPGDLVLSAAAARAGCLLCDGSAVSRATYSALFSAIGVTYGAGDGSTTFNLPDFKGRALVGAGTGAGLSARARGDKTGEETHILSPSEVPTLPVEAQGSPLQVGLATAGAQAGTAVQALVGGTAVLSAVGGEQAHNNMPPIAVANVFIKI